MCIGKKSSKYDKYCKFYFAILVLCNMLCEKKNKLKFDFFDMVNILLYMLFEPYQHAGKCP